MSFSEPDLSFAQTLLRALEHSDLGNRQALRGGCRLARATSPPTWASARPSNSGPTSVDSLHDIGKVGIPASLLYKPGPLILEERREMQRRPAIGESILQPLDSYEEIGLVIRHHHERFDGEGYPDRLAGDEIPLLARIVAVAETYNTMTSTTPYQQTMTAAEATDELDRVAGTQLDPEVVTAFRRRCWRQRHRNTGSALRKRLSLGPNRAARCANPEHLARSSGCRMGIRHASPGRLKSAIRCGHPLG